MCENPTDEQHLAACSVLVDRRKVTPPDVLKPTQPLALWQDQCHRLWCKHPVQLIIPLWCHQPSLVQPESASVQPSIDSELSGNELTTRFWTQFWLLMISSCRVASFIGVCYLCICFLKYFNFACCLVRF